MFALIESAPSRRGITDWPSRMASATLHTALVAGAIYATQRAVTPDLPLIIDQGLVWQTPIASVEPPGASSSPTSSMTTPSWVMPNVPVTISTEIPAPGTTEILPPPGGDPIPGMAVIGHAPGGTILGIQTPLDARVVDEVPTMLAHPELRYPEVLRQAGIEGRVLVEVVLDTLGRAEPGSLHVTQSPNALFDREAVAVVLGSRYRPGRVDGRAVRVRIQVPVSFTIRQ